MSDENIEVEEPEENSGSNDGPMWDKMASLVKGIVSSELDAREEKWQQRVSSNSHSPKPNSPNAKGATQSLGKFHAAFFGTKRQTED